VIVKTENAVQIIGLIVVLFNVYLTRCVRYQSSCLKPGPDSKYLDEWDLNR